MKKWVVFFFICCIANNFSQTSISPQFSELNGMEDQFGNTHLFYRIYTSYTNDPFYNMTNDIYHFDLTNFSDSLFLEDYSHSDPVMSYFRTVKDYAFWDNEFTKYIFCGSMGSWEPGPYLKRFDSDYIMLNYLCCEVNQIDISSFDDSLIFSGGWLNYGSSLRSTDGGFNWDTIDESLKFISLNPFSANILFAFDNSDDLLRSSDGGSSFHLVDTVGNYNWDKFIYDIDEEHIYRTTFKYPFHYLIISNNKGEAFSWQMKYSSDSEIYISTDDSKSGNIYLADKKNIFKSTDYGNNFSLFHSFDNRIVGIYKKASAGCALSKLYAATKYKIYEITPDTIQIIKSLPIPEEVLSHYPLAVGNKWIYDEVTVVQDPYPNYYHNILVKEVFGDTIAPNGRRYYKVNDETIWEPSVLERVDSSEGKVYRYHEDPLLAENEYVAYDLLAEVGDTISSFRMGFNTVMFTTMIANSTFNNWGIARPKKVFEEYTLHPPMFSITQDIGLDSIYFYFDFGNTWITLKGCLVDGVVYGDTTTVGVEEEENPIVTEFKLEQNYPNPFNPTTSIQYAISSRQFVTLKVYDLLGNEIATLVNEELSAGEYEVEFSIANLSEGISAKGGYASGVYFYQLKAGSFIQSKKMILLK